MNEQIIEDELPTAEPTLRESLEATHTEVVEARARDEAGRFAAKEKQEAETPAVKESPTEVKTATAAQEVKPAETPETLQRPTLAPNAWSNAAKAAWVNADPVIKAEIAKREADVHREFTKQDSERQMGRQFNQLTQPYMSLIQAEGGTPVKAFQNYLETTRLLRQGEPEVKAQLVRALCQQFNIDLNHVANAPQIDQRQQSMYTRAQLLEQENQRLQAQIQEAPLQAQIEAFAADPAREHFEALKPAMAALLQGGQAATLQEAYDQALWVRPDIRSTLIDQQFAQREEKRVAEAKAKANAARRAGGSVTGSPGIGASADPQAGKRSLRQELEAAMGSSRV